MLDMQCVSEAIARDANRRLVQSQIAWRLKSMMQKSRADLYTLHGIGHSGLIAIAQCTVLHGLLCGLFCRLCVIV